MFLRHKAIVFFLDIGGRESLAAESQSCVVVIGLLQLSDKVDDNVATAPLS